MDISPFLDRKLARRFATYDTNGDGYVGGEDFARSAVRMAEEFGHLADSPARQRLEELADQIWRHLADVADTDTDGQVSETEYKAAFAAGLLETPASFDAGYLPFLDAIMAIADTDGDGLLTSDEYVRWTGSLMNLPEFDARDVFQRLDADGDHQVSTRDLLEAIREFYFSEDPDSAGSWLLGPLPASYPVR
ncbi:EF hand domain-containing protein [Micromonospora pisi]|uniref:EF hand domain-containing protein n=1 Tax=Micromonospora pisi TaxID=589240 RepID=A0A495JDQ4_9ACTN|nr:EF-hand domain-containing protein [Micromonospora pisi]RKR86861.1 EF hand domain-containing protein [Micromonospora pisi]